MIFLWSNNNPPFNFILVFLEKRKKNQNTCLQIIRGTILTVNVRLPLITHNAKITHNAIDLQTTMYQHVYVHMYVMEVKKRLFYKDIFACS